MSVLSSIIRLFSGTTRPPGHRVTARPKLAASVISQPLRRTPPRLHIPRVDPDNEMTGLSPAALARLRERKRCELIMLSPAAAERPIAARYLAFETRMPRTQALFTLLQYPVEPSADPYSRVKMLSAVARRPGPSSLNDNRPSP